MHDLASQAGSAGVVTVRVAEGEGRRSKPSGKGRDLLSAYSTSLMINNHPDILHTSLKVTLPSALARPSLPLSFAPVH